MRTVSLNARAAMQARETGKVPVFLVTITHPELPEPIRLSTDNSTRISVDPLLYGTISRGNTFYFVGMKVTVPDDKDRAPPSSRLTVMDINQDLIPMIRSVSRPPPKVKMEMVLADDPDQVELDIPVMEITSVEATRESVTLECTIDALIAEPYPSGKFSPAYFPGIF
jgi:hypothetical protein